MAPRAFDENQAIEEIAAENIEAKARALMVWHFVEEVRFKAADRLYFVGQEDMRAGLRRHPKFTETPVSAPHRKILDVFAKEAVIPLPRQIQPGTILRAVKLFSFREDARPSLQITMTESFNGLVYGDMDIDLSSPARDVYGFFVHLFEVLIPGVTDHRKLRKKLEKDRRIGGYFYV